MKIHIIISKNHLIKFYILLVFQQINCVVPLYEIFITSSNNYNPKKEKYLEIAVISRAHRKTCLNKFVFLPLSLLFNFMHVLFIRALIASVLKFNKVFLFPFSVRMWRGYIVFGSSSSVGSKYLQN